MGREGIRYSDKLMDCESKTTLPLNALLLAADRMMANMNESLPVV